MAGMKDSGVEWIGEIPEGWGISPFKHLLARNDGGVWGEEPNDDGEDCVVLRSTEQTVDGEWRIEKPAVRSMKGVSNSWDYVLEPNDLLITKSSGSLDHIGKTTLFAEGTYDQPCMYSNFMQRLRVKECCEPRYFWYLLNCEVSRAQFAYLQNSTIGLGNISAAAIGKVVFPLPTKDEQSVIASALDDERGAIDAVVETLETQVSALERYRASVIHEAVTRGLDPTAPTKPSGVEWIGNIPRGWKMTKLKYETSICNGLDYSAEDICDPEDANAVLVVRSSNISNGEMVHADDVHVSSSVPASCRLKHDDLVIVRANGSAALVGKSALFTLNETAAAGGFMLICRSSSNPYLRWLLQSDLLSFYRGQFETTTIGRISSTLLGNMLVPWPSAEERKAIAEYLNTRTAAIDAVIATKRAQLDVLKRRRQSLIYEYVTGKRRIAQEG